MEAYRRFPCDPEGVARPTAFSRAEPLVFKARVNYTHQFKSFTLQVWDAGEEPKKKAKEEHESQW